MIVLYIILGILLFLFLLTLINLRIYISYKNRLDVKVKYLTFTIVADNAEKEKKSKEKSPKKSEKKQKPKKEKKETSIVKNLYEQRGVSGLINILKYLVNTSVKSIAIVVKHLNIKVFNIFITIADEDSAKTAIKYGRVCAVVYPLTGDLISKLRCKKYDVEVAPDFNKQECETDCYVYARIRPLFIILAALKFIGIIKILIAASRYTPEEGIKNDKDEIKIDKTERKDDFDE